MDVREKIIIVGKTDLLYFLSFSTIFFLFLLKGYRKGMDRVWIGFQKGQAW